MPETACCAVGPPDRMAALPEGSSCLLQTPGSIPRPTLPLHLGSYPFNAPNSPLSLPSNWFTPLGLQSIFHFPSINRQRLTDLTTFSADTSLTSDRKCILHNCSNKSLAHFSSVQHIFIQQETVPHIQGGELVEGRKWKWSRSVGSDSLRLHGL